jgi:hypothetical protein
MTTLTKYGIIVPLFILSLFIQSCSEPFSIVSNPTVSAADFANLHSEFLKTKLLYNKDRLFIKKASLQIGVLDKINHRLKMYENEYDSGGNNSSVIENIQDLEEEYIDWLKETQEILKDYKISKEFAVFDSLNSVKAQEVAQQYMTEKTTQKDNMKKVIMTFLLDSRIPCFDAMISESGCLWVSTVSGSEDPETIGKLLVNKFGQEYNFKCVTVFDNNQKELGRYTK